MIDRKNQELNSDMYNLLINPPPPVTVNAISDR